ncbi:cysteine desulfurase / selenocysteine lyase [Marinagarivorans cellulosilyticus]|uniref:Cysteine desulfurase n=2 Tax=Marinagarivorans cellulosilyticus TaxID=2721545 RepID=A0AAN2BJ47_9GAMM|nr:cysteine desulfurase / selenocysteine lyase [Marinagarivorans cellulosilyticus]
MVMDFDVNAVRAQFPILNQMVNGSPLVYLDSAATTQKPQSVIDAITDYYTGYNSNVHRGAHALADKATIAFEAVRQKVAAFINSPAPEQVLWTRGTTESINLVAHSWGDSHIGEGDVILVSELEHHANIVPWQILAQKKGAKVVPIPLTDAGDIDQQAFTALLTDKVKLLAVSHVSNALGSVNPVKAMVAQAKEKGITTLLDGAQAVAHFPIDVQALGCDFYVFSGHKLFGPTGIGVLWGQKELLASMPPYQGGGEMIETVSFEGTTFNGLPFKFEAGTPHIEGVIGFGAAIDFLATLNHEQVAAHEADLMAYIIEQAKACTGLTLIGQAAHQAGAFSFLLEGAHPADVGMLLDQQGIAVRTGHHCAQPLMSRFNIPGTVRASLSIYNTRDDIDRLFAGLEKAKQFLL